MTIPASPPARPSATVLLLREDPQEGFQVFMVVRHRQIDFASGALVFPGGSVDPGDATLAARPDLCPPMPDLDATGAALRIAAIRETFEECGVLLARARGDSALLPAARLARVEARHRAALCAGERSFAEVLEASELALAPDLLVPFAHWVTPAHMSKRFDTHFFLAVAPADQAATHDGGEAVESVWISPRRALAETEAGRWKLMFPTEMNLRKLARHATLVEAVEATRSARVVTVQPVMLRSENGRRVMRIPAEADYGGEVFVASNPPSI